MPKTGTPLSAAAVRNLRTAGKYYDLHGLFLRIEPSGSRRWVQRLTIDGRQREMGLGSADLITLAEARSIAFDNKKMAQQGGDPFEAKKQKQTIPTFAEAVDVVIELHAPTWSNAKHAAQFRSTLVTYVMPRLGRRLVNDIGSADILSVLQPIWAEKNETAKRVKQRIGTIMKWAIAQGYRPDDPTLALNQVLPKITKQPQHFKSLPYSEVAGCLEVIRMSSAMPTTKLAIEFLVLTAARSGEVRLADWREIDLDKKTWSIPAERTKTKQEHVVPLSDRAIQILKDAEAHGSSGLIFPGMIKGRPMSDMTMSKLVKELGFPVDIHGFRTSFRTWVQEQTDASFEVAEKALSHKTSSKIVAAYARSDLFEKRRTLMEQWARYLNA
ncbi:tyrosine-type recombinase/integrase [Rhodobacterales bacterium HKCCA1288]|nr:tyrosine-type recombinase/integrase [Rhodobacterales bacterium HKCCA1288]